MKQPNHTFFDLLQRVFITVALLIFCLYSNAGLDHWIPQIDNFGENDYGKGYFTWNISSAGQMTYFANGRGLLEYDGYSWHSYELNNRASVRGVLAQPRQRRVWAGGESEFGYFEITSTGALAYHCVSDRLKHATMQRLGNVFAFYEAGGVTYARCDFGVVTMSGEHISAIFSPIKMFSSSMLRGALYVGTEHGLRVLVGTQFQQIPSTKALDGMRIDAMTPYRNGLLIGSSGKGLFFFDGNKLTPYATPVDAQLHDDVVCVLTVIKNQIAIGTQHHGLLIIDTATQKVSIYDEGTGLQSNTIQSFAFDGNGNLWVGLDYGIDLLRIYYPFSYLYTAPSSYGIGYSVAIDGNRLYVGTDRGLYTTAYPVPYILLNPQLQPVKGLNGSAWQIQRFGSDLFCLHDKGIFLIHGLEATRVTSISGAWNMMPVNGHNDMMWVGVYNGVYLIKKINGQWQCLGRVSGLNESGKFLRQTGPRELHVYNPSLGRATVYTLSSNLLKVTGQRKVKERFLPEAFKHAPLPMNGNDARPLVIDANHEVIPFSNGFMLYNKKRLMRSDLKLIIGGLWITEPTDSCVYRENISGIRPEPRISWSHNSVRIEYFASARFPNYTQTYQYRLNGGDWSAPTTSTVKEFSNLPDRAYTFEVRTTMVDGSVQTATLKFRILPPWYRTWIAYLIYLIIIGVLVWQLWRYMQKHIEEQKQGAVKVKEEEISHMKVEITQLEKDKMEMDLRHKSQEIANLMTSVNSKNDILSTIKGEIQKVIAQLPDADPKELKKDLVIINGRIDSNMDGDDVLKRFEQEFDLVNDNFMRRLRERHPGLNNNELLMCAYLRMNLRSKEIAPLLNISVRGVETIRYRLRKKLDLERDASLTDYLKNL